MHTLVRLRRLAIEGLPPDAPALGCTPRVGAPLITFGATLGTCPSTPFIHLTPMTMRRRLGGSGPYRILIRCDASTTATPVNGPKGVHLLGPVSSGQMSNRRLEQPCMSCRPPRTIAGQLLHGLRCDWQPQRSRMGQGIPVPRHCTWEIPIHRMESSSLLFV
jgi:hypothetical protein